MDAFPTLVEFYALIVLLNEFYQFNKKKILAVGNSEVFNSKRSLNL